jgi:4-diphosphocytidyl-2-C-methyl-D-erythritol kinase
MVCFPNAKINLGLNVIEKRNDGFHNIESVFYPVQWCDVLEIVEDRSQKSEVGNRKSDDEIIFSATGLSIDGEVKNNLCVKAIQLLKKDFQIPDIKMHLHKIIPMGAGLGGGSSDAAFTLKLLTEYFHWNLSSGDLKNYAKQIGSDCSFFIDNVPAFASGRGEILEKIDLDLKEYFILIVKPDVHVSTAEAYNMVKPAMPQKSIKEIIRLPFAEWKTFLKNDFEEYVFENFAIIGEIKRNMYQQGALYSSMSGSGSAVYGIFEKKVYDKNIFKDFLVYDGRLGNNFQASLINS